MNLLEEIKLSNAELELKIKELEKPVKMDTGSWIIFAIISAASFALAFFGASAIIGN